MWLGLLLTAFVLFGCVHTHELVRTSSPSEQAKLQRNATGYVAVPQDGRYGPIHYQGSGETTAQVVQSVFARYLRHVARDNTHASYNAALERAQGDGFTYLIYPTILHWEDRATEWSGRSDKVAVKIAVIDTSSGNVIDSVIVKGKSKWATFGGDHPQDLLPQPVEEWVSTLFE